MNKNFFRALRREIKSIFKNYLISNRFSTSKCKRTFKTNLRRFCDYLLMNSNDYDKKIGEDFESASFQKILGVLLNTCTSKRIFNDDKSANRIEELNSLLSSYSHQKFYSFVAVSEVRFIISIVFKEIGIIEFVQKHRSLSLNRDSYIEHINSILTMN